MNGGKQYVDLLGSKWTEVNSTLTYLVVSGQKM